MQPPQCGSKCHRDDWHLARLQLGGVDRQFAYALASRGKDRVGDRGHNGRCPGLAHPARRLEILHDVDLDGRCLIHAQNLVSVEIGLLDTAIFEGDFAIERRRDAEDIMALWICASTVSGLTTVPQSTAQTT